MKKNSSDSFSDLLSPEVTEYLNESNSSDDDEFDRIAMAAEDTRCESETCDDIMELNNMNDDDIDQCLSLQIPMHVSIKADKYAVKIAKLCDHILTNYYVKICNCSLYVYDGFRGNYTRKDKMESLVFIESCFSSDDRISLSNKVIDEVFNKLLRTPELQMQPDEFNTDITEINCLCGIVKIGGLSIELLPHTPSKFFTYCIQANLIQNPAMVSCPAFDHFCATSLDDAEEKRTLILQIFGYACSDSNMGKAAMFFKGEPNSGKSVSLEVLSLLIGKENISSISIHNLGDRFCKAGLFGVKANIQAEMKSGKIPDISTFKAITGSDRIMGEYKGKSPFYFTPRCTLIFAGNVMPGTREIEATSALKNRIIPLLFNKSIRAEDQDTQLKQKLIDELDSIFTLSMYAVDKLHKQNYKFDLPVESREFLEAYSAVENSVKTFLEERCTLSGSVFNSDLIVAYNRYCSENGLELYSRQKFYTLLDNTAGLRRCRIRKGGQNRWGYKGLKLLDILEQEQQT